MFTIVTLVLFLLGGLLWRATRPAHVQHWYGAGSPLPGPDGAVSLNKAAAEELLDQLEIQGASELRVQPTTTGFTVTWRDKSATSGVAPVQIQAARRSA